MRRISLLLVLALVGCKENEKTLRTEVLKEWIREIPALVDRRDVSDSLEQEHSADLREIFQRLDRLENLKFAYEPAQAKTKKIFEEILDYSEPRTFERIEAVTRSVALGKSDPSPDEIVRMLHGLALRASLAFEIGFMSVHSVRACSYDYLKETGAESMCSFYYSNRARMAKRLEQAAVGPYLKQMRGWVRSLQKAGNLAGRNKYERILTWMENGVDDLWFELAQNPLFPAKHIRWSVGGDVRSYFEFIQSMSRALRSSRADKNGEPIDSLSTISLRDQSNLGEFDWNNPASVKELKRRVSSYLTIRNAALQEYALLQGRKKTPLNLSLTVAMLDLARKSLEEGMCESKASIVQRLLTDSKYSKLTGIEPSQVGSKESIAYKRIEEIQQALWPSEKKPITDEAEFEIDRMNRESREYQELMNFKFRHWARGEPLYRRKLVTRARQVFRNDPETLSELAELYRMIRVYEESLAHIEMLTEDFASREPEGNTLENLPAEYVALVREALKPSSNVCRMAAETLERRKTVFLQLDELKKKPRIQAARRRPREQE